METLKLKEIEQMSVLPRLSLRLLLYLLKFNLPLIAKEEEDINFNLKPFLFYRSSLWTKKDLHFQVEP